VALECCAADVATLIEKPLATSVREGEMIARVAEQHRATVAVGYVTRFTESVQLMAGLLKSGYFGRVRRFGYQCGSTGRWAPLSAYTLDRHASGGGVVVVTGTHFLDRMLFWFGYPDEVEYQDDSSGGPEANAQATFHYSSGDAPFEGRARFSKTVPLRNGFVMETDAGMVILRDDDQTPIILRPGAQLSLETIVQSRGDPLVPRGKKHFQLQLEDFVAACRTGGPPRVSVQQGLESLRLIEALYACRSPMKMDWYPCPRLEAKTL
jgi:predicted dehydrogenase